MPTYEYECQKCAHLFEAFQSMTDAPLRKCPACGGKVKRLLGTGAGIVFKGSGFYETDYKRSAASAKGGAAKSDSTAKSDSAASDSSSSGSGDAAPKADSTKKTGGAKPAGK